MADSKKKEQTYNLPMEDTKIKQVKQFRYLRNDLIEGWKCDYEIRRRIGVKKMTSKMLIKL